MGYYGIIFWDVWKISGIIWDTMIIVGMGYARNKQQSTGVGFGDFDELGTFGNNMKC